MATIVVAPARLFRLAEPITTETAIFCDAVGEFAGRGAAQAYVDITEPLVSVAFGDAEVLIGRARGGDDRFDVTGLAADGFDRSLTKSPDLSVHRCKCYSACVQ